MRKSASRRRFLRDTALAAAGSVLGANSAQTDELRLAQAQGPAPIPTEALNRGLPRIHLMVGPGTLPSMGKDRMDLLRYRLSGNARLTGEQLIEPLPEIAKVARVDVDKTTSWGQGSYDDLRKLSLRIEEVLQSPEIDGAVYVQGTNTIEETAYFLNLTVHSE
jgi:L-asparaginase/Glu-tRNA(Gln) amidotransferase subunit D